MRRFALATLATLFTVVACQDATTAPVAQSPNLTPRDLGTFSGDNPPPPPIDSGSVGTASTSTTTVTAQFNVTYMFNKPENSGWLKFNRDAYDNTDIDNSAAVRLTNGVYSGKGIIRLFGDAGTFVIDLSKVTFGSTSFSECTSPTIGTTDGAPTCFQLDLGGSGVTLKLKDGTSVQGGFRLSPEVKRTEVCIGDSSEACIITAG